MSDNVIKFLLLLINEDRPDDFKELLNKLPLNTMNAKKADMLMGICLTNIAANKNEKCAKILYDAFSSGNPQEESFSLLAMMLTNLVFSDDQIRIILLAIPNMTIFDLFLQLTSRDDSSEANMGVERLLEVFNVELQTDSRLRIVTEMIDMIDEKESPMIRIRETLASKYGEWAPHVDPPSYMIEYKGQTVPEDVRVEIANEDYVKIATELTQEATKDDILFDDPKGSEEAIVKMLKESDMEEKESIIEPLRCYREHETLTQDDEIFRFFGPSHPTVGNLMDKETPCGEYGGCRMFLCVCREIGMMEHDVDDFYQIEWFTGTCDHCKLKILKKKYAVRIPSIDGGWHGCYCSFKCAREDVYIDEEGLVTELIDEFEADLQETKIYDYSSE